MSRRVTFLNDDGHELVARFEAPSEPVGYALLAHCFTCSKDSTGLHRLSRALVEQGIGVLRFDFTGLGESEGDFADTSFSSNIHDLVAAARYMQSQGQDPALLIGHSLGGAAVLKAAAEIPSARAVATIAAPSSPMHVKQHLQPIEQALDEAGQAKVELGGRTFTIRKQFVEDLETHDMERVIASLGRALLVLHSPADEVVGVDEATRIFVTAKHPKSFVSLDDADHLLSRGEDARYAGLVIGAWAKRYLETNDARAAASNERRRVVVRGGANGFRSQVEVGPHALLVDEPAELGGTDTGPTPYDYLTAALGACTVMTLRMYADHKGIPLEHATVMLEHRKIHARDCADCETRGDAKIDLIERELVLTGALSDEQKQALVRIADRCPVHRTLTSEVAIETKLEEDVDAS